jgi:hypothetical protein
MRITSLTRRAAVSAALAAAVIAPGSALADGHSHSKGGELLVSGSEYTPADIQPGVTELPPRLHECLHPGQQRRHLPVCVQQ